MTRAMIPGTAMPFALALAMVMSLSPREAHTEPAPADKETARALWLDGAAKQKQGDHRAALTSFEAAHALVALSATGIEVARERQALGLLLEARDMALTVARMPAATPEEESVKADALALYEQLGPQIPALEVVVKGLPAGLEYRLSVDGASIPREAAALPRRVNPGSHSIVVEAAGHASATRTVTVKETTSERVEVTLQKLPDPPPPAGVVKLHIESDDATVHMQRATTVPLGQSISGSMQWGVFRGALEPRYGVELTPICNAPCDRTVDGRDGEQFVFGGRGTLLSDRFQLLGKSGEWTARVHTATETRRTAGKVLLTAGAAGVLGAIVTLVLGAVENSIGPASPWVWPAGTVVGGASSGLLGVGAYFLATGSTTFELSPTRAR